MRKVISEIFTTFLFLFSFFPAFPSDTFFGDFSVSFFCPGPFFPFCLASNLFCFFSILLFCLFSSCSTSCNIFNIQNMKLERSLKKSRICKFIYYKTSLVDFHIQFNFIFITFLSLLTASMCTSHLVTAASYCSRSPVINIFHMYIFQQKSLKGYKTDININLNEYTGTLNILHSYPPLFQS